MASLAKTSHRWDLHFQVEVGTGERHVLDVSWDQVWGVLTVLIDGIRSLEERHMFGFRRVRRYQLTVGEREVHKVVLEKRKVLFIGGIAKQTIEVFVDGDRLATRSDTLENAV
jgi:hypothetical protein